MNRQSPVVEAWTNDPWDDVDHTASPQVERHRANRRWMRWVVFSMGWLALLGIVAGGIVGLWYVRKINPDGDPGKAQTFTISATDTIETVSRRLHESGLVSDAALFRWYVKDHGGLTLTPGYYLVRPNDHMGNVMSVLSTPPSETYTKLTFPEGYTLTKMAARTAEKLPRLSATDFMTAASSGEIRSAYSLAGQNSLEGLLFPDTYQVSNSETESMVVRRMVTQMERVLRQEQIDTKAAALSLTPYQVLIVASMIEREAKTDGDRAKIARVIYNRIFFDMRLQVDATLYYGQDPNLSFPQLKAIDTPYNTYLHGGLPPTPIANPGRESIHAALNPAPNPFQGDPLCADLKRGEPCAYMFYVRIDEEGNHAFAVNESQHAANIEKARELGVL
ncbi:MAG TPA: endolytic transglycosylase MltG [Ilumatobacteraceae bacterium]|nr:endolytic transglycosylase MltG [Ilumatobacteraceae bacterium]